MFSMVAFRDRDNNAAENTTHGLETILRYRWQPSEEISLMPLVIPLVNNFNRREVNVFSMAAIS